MATTKESTHEDTFRAQEAAYQDARGNWKRKVLRTEREFERFAAKMEESGRDWRIRDYC